MFPKLRISAAVYLMTGSMLLGGAAAVPASASVINSNYESITAGEQEETAESTPETTSTADPEVTHNDDPAGAELAESISSVDEQKAKYTYGISCPNLSSRYYVEVTNALRVSIEDAGSALLILDAKGDATRQKSQICQLVDHGVDGIFILPIETTGMTETLETVYNAQIPMVGMLTELSDMSYLESFIGMDHYRSGQLVAEKIAEQYPDGCSVLLLEQSGSANVAEHISGFRDAAKNLQIKIAASTDGGGTREAASAAAEQLLKEHPECKILVAGSDMMALGALDAVAAAELTETVVYGFGGSPDFKSALSKGNAAAAGTGADSLAAVAAAAAQVMNGYLDGTKVQARYALEPFIIDASNVADYGTEGWQ
ncbi:MAG: substrate-binding domain-containing protein [Lachnospiraceae bacterium]|nr:substrate-binding domain-containing protein [Lachnospiraceae bacterium]